MDELCFGDEEDLPVSTEAVAEFGVLTVEKELLVESLNGAQHEACSHDLGDGSGFRRCLDYALAHPIGVEKF